MADINSIRSHRIFGIAIFDLVMSMVLLALFFVIIWYLRYRENLNVINFIIAGILLAIPLGIFFHVLFGVDTTLNYKLGLSNAPKKPV